MVPEGYVEYKRREFCKDVKCPVQVELNQQTEGSPSIRADTPKMRHRLLIHHMAVSSLAHRKRLFNSKTKHNQKMI